MLPSIIIMAGCFVSEQARHTQSFGQIRGYFEQLGNIVREKELEYLRDHTEWIFVPSINDPGQMDLMPQVPLADHLLAGFTGTH